MDEHDIDDDPIAVIEDEARAVARSFGISASEDVAAMFVERIMLRLGGESIYVPRRRLKDRQRVIAEIRARFTGRNAAVLAREFGVSVRWVRKVAVV
ncbi:Mor transcription activator family protein [Thauera butanivorans]|uniref:Mor transcription activator family protein n=1 Tax=Thauera butanivorans TaxID=86174 RepID=UPI00083916EC|nr:Mor transcription activator family protein [Thauera butanivorans]